MAKSHRKQKELVKQDNGGPQAPNRPWHMSVAWSAVAVAVLLVVAVVGNLLVGRVIHWNIVTVLGTLGFVFLSIGRRYRTI